MDASFAIGLLCFLLIIPQHGNSPLPRVESWLQKEQDDGFLDGDMSSSLTGDESFGLAHQNYQKSLIHQRKVKSDVLRAPLMAGKRKYANLERMKQEDPYESDNANANADADYNKEERYLKHGKEPVFEDFDGDADSFQYEKYKAKLNDKYQNNQGMDARYFSKFPLRGNERLRSMAPMAPFRSPLRYHKGDSRYMEGEEMRDCRGSFCTNNNNNNKNKFAPDITLGVMEVLKLEGGNKEKNFENGEETGSLTENEENLEPGRFRVKNELNRQGIRGFVPKKRNFGERGGIVIEKLKGKDLIPVEGKDLLPLEGKDLLPLEGKDLLPVEGKDLLPVEGKDQSSVEGEDYYEAKDKAPGIQENNENSEFDDYYDQLEDHEFLCKREECKQQPVEIESDKNNVEPGAHASDASLKEEDKTKTLTNEKSELVKSNAGGADPIKEQSDEAVVQNADLVWKMNNNLQAQELNNVMKDSQRALEEVQLFQQKLNLKANNNPSGEVKYEESAPASAESKDIDKAKDNRAKREDEDEQKNMKTGTDEGGGGEYEDEEGKGHNDEEEYYEEMDDAIEEDKDKSLKRDTERDEEVSNRKTKSEMEVSAADEDEDEDDELSLKNAPVENVEDQKRFKLEGKKDEKKDVRKGPKIWDQWGKWSPCSVTCGVGRSVRWRHCIGGGCAQGEKEAQIKKCTNPAC